MFTPTVIKLLEVTESILSVFLMVVIKLQLHGSLFAQKLHTLTLLH